MDVHKMREIIYHPLKQQKLPKCIKHNFDKFSVSTYDLLYPYEMYCLCLDIDPSDNRWYLNDLLNKMHADYNMSEETDNNMYVNALKLSSAIYDKLYNHLWAF